LIADHASIRQENSGEMARLLLCGGIFIGFISVMAGRSGVSQSHNLPEKHTSTEDLSRPKTIAFEVVSIRPIEKPDPDWSHAVQIAPTSDGYEGVEKQPLWTTIMFAYYQSSHSPLSWKRSVLAAAPLWVMKNQYAINARVAPEDLAAWQKPDPERTMLRGALRQMLVDRCKLVLHTTTTEQLVYALMIRRGAKLKLKEADPNEAIPADAQRITGEGALESIDHRYTSRFIAISTNYLAAYLSTVEDRPVVDMTGLTGRYDFVLQGRNKDGEEELDDPGPPWDLAGLGLMLRPRKAPVETLVIDHIEEPSEN
jgi:uncharacterized protein (TIGR03435 family)